jgi:hypothetical protein
VEQMARQASVKMTAIDVCSRCNDTGRVGRE